MRLNEGAQRKGRMWVRIQETKRGGALACKVPAIMAADGHLRAVGAEWHKIKTKRGS